MIIADISNFSKPYDHLNQTNKNLKISKFMLTRSVMMVGQSGYQGMLGLGFYRMAQLLCLTLANIEKHNGYLKLVNSFFSLDASEKRAVSYHLGMGFAKACAELLLKIPWLQHISNNPNVIISSNNLNIPPKISICNTNKNPKAPDLLGFDVAKQPHVFEAKGYSSGMNFIALQHAINQVSQVLSIDQKSPSTRVACFYDMSGTSIHGRIIDPSAEDKNNSGIHIKIDSLKFIFEYYALFTSDPSWLEAGTIEIFDRVFRIRALGAPDIYFGIDTKIHDSVLDSKDPSENIEFFSENYEQINSQIGQADVSVGLDGIILLRKQSLREVKKLKKTLSIRILDILDFVVV